MYILLGLLIVYVAFSYARFLYILKNNTLPTITQTDQTFGSGSPLVYVAAGDSTAVGVGASDITQTYTYKVAEHLGRHNRITYHNVAKSGARTDDVLSVQLEKIITANPDIVTLSIGANDVTHLKSNEAILENYRAIIAKLISETHARIYLANIPILKDAPLLPLPYRKIMEYKARTINRELAKLATERIRIVPIHDFGWDQFPDIRVTFASDLFHPSDSGYENWTNAFKLSLELP
jgi:acyl-CoA thioesterase I